MRHLALALVVALLAGCGGAVSGSGSQTLFVWARFSTDGSTNGSNGRVSIRSGGANGEVVTDATVSVSGPKQGKTQLVADMVNNSTDYRAVGFPWDDTLNLEIIRGQERVEASVKSPGVTAITYPTNEGSITASGGLTITWTDANKEPANTVHISMERAMVNVTLADDKFSYTVPTDKLMTTDREGLNLERTNDVALLGGTPGSVMSVTTQHYVRFAVQ